MTRRSEAYVLVLTISTLATTLLTRPLWFRGGLFPKVPFVPVCGRIEIELGAVLIGSLFAATAASSLGLIKRSVSARRSTSVAQAIAVACFVVLVSGDQHRFQPWVYQYVMTIAAIMIVPGERGERLCRLFMIALYLHSGLSKLDVSFRDEMGGVFLDRTFAAVGVDATSWPRGVRSAAIWFAPAFEIAIGLALARGRTRTIGAVGAIALHGTLLYVLGPRGLDHSAGVLAWNAAVAVEVAVLFLGAAGRNRHNLINNHDDTRDDNSFVQKAFSFVFIFLIFIAPCGERAGLFDTWPSFGLYASHAERTIVLIAVEDLVEYPESIVRHTKAVAGIPGRLVLDLTAWSRAERDAPVYPQNRALNGVAEALAMRYVGRRPIRVEHLGRAGLFSGRRDRVRLIGLDAIREHARSFVLNARPAERAESIAKRRTRVDTKD